jgi:hypothetical protein
MKPQNLMSNPSTSIMSNGKHLLDCCGWDIDAVLNPLGLDSHDTPAIIN